VFFFSLFLDENNSQSRDATMLLHISGVARKSLMDISIRLLGRIYLPQRKSRRKIQVLSWMYVTL